MRIICLDDHRVMLNGLVQKLNTIVPDAEIYPFQTARTALECAQETGCDVLFCEIKLAGEDGLVYAEKIRQLNPRVNIIFTTVCGESERAGEVMKLRPSSYITKPYTREQIAEAMENLRYPVPSASAAPTPAPEPAPQPERGSVQPRERRPMKQKALKKLGRTDLLEMLIEQTKEVDRLKGLLADAEQQLDRQRRASETEIEGLKERLSQARLAAEQAARDSREPASAPAQDSSVILATEVGSIAQLAMEMNGVFEAAQRAADQYLETVCHHAQRQLESASRRDSGCVDRMEKLLADTRTRCSDMEAKTIRRCEEMTEQARREAQSYWDDAYEKMEAYLGRHEEIRSVVLPGLISTPEKGTDHEKTTYQFGPRY